MSTPKRDERTAVADHSTRGVGCNTRLSQTRLDGYARLAAPPPEIPRDVALETAEAVLRERSDADLLAVADLLRALRGAP